MLIGYPFVNPAICVRKVEFCLEVTYRTNSIVKFSCDALGGVSINCVIDNGVLWVKAKDAAGALMYKDTDDAIRARA